MKKNIMDELYGPGARKKEDDAGKKKDGKEKEMEDDSGNEMENTLYAKPSKTQLICPKCKGQRIKPATADVLAVYGSPDQRYICDDCGYTGSLVLDVSEQEKSEYDILMEEDLMRIKKEMEYELK